LNAARAAVNVGPMSRSYPEDLALVRAVSSGSDEAWKQFVERYTGLLLSVFRRYLFDEDEARTAYVDILERLKRGTLATYAGRAALSTWLVLVARSTAQDFLRRKFGRREIPRGLESVSELDREIFRLFYIEGMSFEAVRHWATRGERLLSAEELADALRRIEERVDDRVLRRIAYDLGSTSVGAGSERLLEFIDAYRSEVEARHRAWDPEFALQEKETKRLAQQIRAAIDGLPVEDRHMLELRFDKGWSAKQIAEEMQLEGAQRAYTLIRRGLRRLRKVLKDRE